MGCTSRCPPDPLPANCTNGSTSLFPTCSRQTTSLNRCWPCRATYVPATSPAITWANTKFGGKTTRGHDAHRKFWAAESSKRFLASQIAVGTVDQAMMGALKVRHGHMRAACLARNLLVVDEVHASDAYMRAIIEALLDAHTAGGGYALLMSATLGSAARHSLLSRGPREDSRRPAHARRSRGHSSTRPL